MRNQQITAALNRNLHFLNIIRSFIAIGQTVALFYFSVIDDIGLRLPPLFIILGLMCLFSVATFIRLASRKQVSELEFFIHLSMDMLALALMLYFSGGASNPFISYLLVPVAIGSSILRWNYSAALALFGLIAYSLLLFYHVPVHALMMHGDMAGMGAMGSLNLHLAGMWLNYVVSAILIAYFIVRMAQTINQQRQQLTEQREQQMESDRLVAVATLAANTAHQLGTPINSISLLARELDELEHRKGRQPVLEDLQTQVNRCKEILQSLVSTADIALSEKDQTLPVQHYFKDLLDRWSVLHPGQAIDINQGSLSAINREFLAPKSLEPAIFNLLNNAAQSGADKIQVAFESDEDSISMRLNDNGSGIAPEVVENIGRPFNSDKPQGMGIGLYLAITTAEAMGGSLVIKPVKQGTSVCLKLPTI